MDIFKAISSTARAGRNYFRRWSAANEEKKKQWDKEREINRRYNSKIRSRQVCRAIARQEEFLLVSGQLDEPRKNRRRIALNRARRAWREISAEFFAKKDRVAVKGKGKRSKAAVAAEAHFRP